MNKIKIALIGLGRISIKHLEAIRKNPKAELVAVSDLYYEKYNEKLERKLINENIPFYSDYQKLLNENKLDLVSICTDSGSHAEIALASLSKGINTLIEKPLALNISDAKNIIKLAKDKNVFVSVCHQNRFNIAIEELIKVFDDKKLGVISHISGAVRWSRNFDYYNQAEWRGKWKTDGGCLMNQCIHNADILSLLLGDIDEIYAYTANVMHPYLEVEDVGLALIKSKKGIIASFEGTVNVYPTNLEETISVFGSKGTVIIGGKSLNKINHWDVENCPIDNKNNYIENVENVYGNGHIKLYDNILDSIEINRAPLITGEDGLKALEIILAIYKSMKTGKPVKLPLQDFSTIDMEK